MLEKVKEYAMIKYAGDEHLATQFVAGFIKEAAENGGFASSVLGSIGRGVGAMGIGLGLHGLNMAFVSTERGNLHNQFLEALQKAISMNRLLRDADKAKVEQYAATIFKFAPHVSTDPNLLSSVLASAVQGHEGAGLDPMTIKMLSDLESRYVENRTSGGFTPKTYV